MNKITYYIPTKDKHGQSIQNTECRLNLLKNLATKYGGSTQAAAQGSFLHENGQLVIEDISLIYTFGIADIEQLRLEALKLKEELNQESILIEIDGKPLFV